MERTKPEGTPSPNSQKGFLMCQVLLRTLSIAATLIATALMATNKETIRFFGIEMDAKYSYASALTFYVAANSAASFISLVSLFAVIYYVSLAKSGHCQKKYYTIFLLDLMVVMCLVSGSSAASTIAYTGKYGNSHAGWMPICDHFGKWCNKVVASLLSSYAAALLSLILTVWSSWKALATSNSDFEDSLKIRDNKVGNEFVSAI
ncbi:hypothetical protein ACHQM5_011721 [Ranunculus cassubicifolius]